MPSSKFNVARPPETRTASTPPTSERVALNFTEADTDPSDAESGNEREDVVERSESGRTKAPPVARMSGTTRSGQPRLSRSLSMPSPSQLRHFMNPHRSHSLTPAEEIGGTLSSDRLQEVSVELADSVEMLGQIMLQITPQQVLDPAKEHLSACSLSVPTSAMSAILTSIKNINYILANTNGLCSSSNATNEDELLGPPPALTDFDMGEMLQSLGDSLSGAAASAGVDLVLYHGGDFGLRQMCVKGPENGIANVLSHVVRQVMATTQLGDTIELGLFVGPISADDDSVPPESEDPLSCTIRISHKFCSSSTVARSRPTLSSLLLQRLLQQTRATLTPDLPLPILLGEGRTCDFTIALDRGSLSVMNTPAPGQDVGPIIEEPSVDQLTLFADTLKGERVTLYANAKGSFAQHLTSYLTAWGMEITHVSPDGEVDGLTDSPPSPTTLMPAPSRITDYRKDDSPTSPTSPTDRPSFVFIDDDVEVLKQRLLALRVSKDKTYYSSLQKRPSLASRAQSSPRVNRIGISTPALPLPGSVVLVHFTSIGNYKLVKDVIHNMTASHAGTSTPLPDVMIIPKPAGPRRFLTALHTAVTKPPVDPFFSPIATTPSPIAPTNGFFFGHHSETGSSRPSPKPQRPTGSRTNSANSDRSNKSISVISTNYFPPPSPLAIPDNVEYFSEAATSMGASPSAGIVLQSPDGQSQGILFQPPRGKSPRNPSAQSMERDKGQLTIPEPKRSSRMLNNDANGLSFSALQKMTITSPTRSTEHRKSSSSTPSLRPFSRKPSTTLVGDESPIASTSAPRRLPSIDPTRNATPPGSPQPDEGAVSRRPTPRRGQQETASPSPSTALAAVSRKIKAAADGSVIPPISVLIVEDNPINQAILSTFMKKKKIKYDVANNGQEAVSKFRTGNFHLILMDIQMPIMDGIQATKEIRRLEKINAVAGYPPRTPSSEENSTPGETPSETKSSSPYRSAVIILALTASSLKSDRVAALGAGCNDFLTKPVSHVWLNIKITEWGSLKALQMLADHRPSEEINTMSTEQAVQARNVAERLHVPQGRSSPSPGQQVPIPPKSRTPPPVVATVITANSNSSYTTAPSNAESGVSTLPEPRTHDRSSPLLGQVSFSPPFTQVLEEQTKDMAIMGRRRSVASSTSAAASIHGSEASSTSVNLGKRQEEDNEDDRNRPAALLPLLRP